MDNEIAINGAKYRENDLSMLLAIKDRDIEYLKQTLQFATNSPLNLDVLANIMDPPALDLERSSAEAINYDDPEEEYDYLHAADQPDQPRNYNKKQTKSVTNPDTLHALKYRVDNVRTYSRVPFRGLEIKGVRYAF